jgi:hypothetical protein
MGLNWCDICGYTHRSGLWESKPVRKTLSIWLLNELQSVNEVRMLIMEHTVHLRGVASQLKCVAPSCCMWCSLLHVTVFLLLAVWSTVL